MDRLTSVQNAHELVYKHVPHLGKESVMLSRALGKILARSVICSSHQPPFDQSAMDGYAVTIPASGQSPSERNLIENELPAGKFIPGFKLRPGQAVRIFTGSRIPPGTIAVWLSEYTEEVNGKLVHKGVLPADGSNIRTCGSHVRKGEVVIPEGSRITAGLIGLCASMNVSRLTVYRHPLIRMIITGDELVRSGTKRKAAGIFESNSATLSSAFAEFGFEISGTRFVKDDPAAISAAVKSSLKDADVLILSGGISGSGHDRVKEALESCGVKCIFHRIAQKPGKPLFFGTRRKKAVFALPGNPAAALICFYEYVLPAVRRMSGYMHPRLLRMVLPLKNNFTKKKGLALFLKARVEGGEVLLLEGQESYMLKPFLRANAIAFVHEDETELKPGTLLEVDMLPA